jgi:hypothetical protein
VSGGRQDRIDANLFGLIRPCMQIKPNIKCWTGETPILTLNWQSKLQIHTPAKSHLQFYKQHNRNFSLQSVSAQIAIWLRQPAICRNPCGESTRIVWISTSSLFMVWNLDLPAAFFPARLLLYTASSLIPITVIEIIAMERP